MNASFEVSKMESVKIKPSTLTVDLVQFEMPQHEALSECNKECAYVRVMKLSLNVHFNSGSKYDNLKKQNKKKLINVN